MDRKIKPTPYFHTSRQKPGHDVSFEEAKKIVENPEIEEYQPDGLIRRFGRLSDRAIRTVIKQDSSLAASGVIIGVTRIINAFKDSNYRKKNPTAPDDDVT